ncbi:RNA-binding protein [Mycobacterium sp. 236(2023)]|uniref:RNA-binding protein n=1 Tax=Mycobacterium sp. 236(2023) TaxID=3038163 RepID=UPI00241595E9|nr:RNA-binding protein [Mycobacterium sp. 236(2023)]MDG4664179.1 RNA-binding protein [Mycobacterium sp. 236(2023)]
MRTSWLVVAAAVVLGGALAPAPPSRAVVCGSVGGVHLDVTGCSDPLSELNDVLDYPPPPPPPPVYIPPTPNVAVCADVGRRINVSGCI